MQPETPVSVYVFKSNRYIIKTRDYFPENHFERSKSELTIDISIFLYDVSITLNTYCLIFMCLSEACDIT